MKADVFQDWTIDLVKARIIEAAETLRASPAALGPRAANGAFSELIAAHIATEYDRAPAYRVIPTAGALSRMEKTWEWVNTYLDEAERKLVYDYGFIKSRKGMYLEQYLSKNDMVRRTFERKINRCCQTIALALNRKHMVRLGIPVDSVSQNKVDITSTTVSSESRERSATHWLAPDAKPQIDPALPDKRYIDHREVRARQSDKNRSLGAR